MHLKARLVATVIDAQERFGSRVNTIGRRSFDREIPIRIRARRAEIVAERCAKIAGEVVKSNFGVRVRL